MTTSTWKMHRLKKTAHVETFYKQYNHEVSWNFYKNWSRHFALSPHPLSVTQPQIKQLGNSYLCIVLRNSDKKFHKIWSRGCEEMASDVRTAWQLYTPPKFFGELENYRSFRTMLCSGLGQTVYGPCTCKSFDPWLNRLTRIDSFFFMATMKLVCKWFLFRQS